MAAKGTQGLLDNFFTVVSKMPKDKTVFNMLKLQPQGLLKVSLFWLKTT